MQRSYAIGDVHGHLNKLRAAHALIAADRTRTGDMQAPVVHLGDLVDRGPNCRGVLDFLIGGLAEGAPWVLLRGNHDRFMQYFLRPGAQPEPARPDLDWLSPNVGGRETLASYGVETGMHPDRAALHAAAVAAVPQSHVDLLEGLLPCYRRGDVFFCHAGVRPGVPLDDQAEDDLIWIRREFLDDPRDHGALIVHGHTPVQQVTHYGNRVNLDTGAGYGGPVSAVVIEGNAVFHLTEEGRVPLTPQG
ncbi:metallophosphoesterase [Rhodovulum adriaticum]|uniref:Serine/threonine protein phosphatase 1 n=2 Tax=Rhodovulum adriaticum TaxID=35804 RepID=A0A4R2NZ51_RHOAD|nr:metallophosphoesterase [Rhodovulum adriaticum]MBK1634991.1 serine/threonine protein phosphatase [Rhodovulum adriaticum]TCP27462.1 serine/threonine protein phosphatase 1 [Rhodovulum adriaticum]